MKIPPFPSRGGTPRFVERYHLGGIRFEEVEYPSGLDVSLHSHEAVYLDLCVTGTIQERWRERKFARGPLTLNYLPQGAPHGNHFGEQVRTFQIVLSGGWLQRAPQGSAPVCFDRGLPNWTASRLYREFRQRDDVTPLVLEGLLLELLAQISRQSARREERGCPPWLRETRDYLHDHFTEGVAISEVATAVGVHPAHLMRAFRQRHGCTIGEYVRRLRVEYASHLLSTSNTSLTQIAVEAGFAEQSHFNRTFKSVTGMVPSEFRRLSRRDC